MAQESTEEIIKRLGLKTLEQSLKKTLFLINFGAMKNMQAVVDEAFDEITKAKQHWYWRRIVDCINQNTSATTTVESIKTMYKRARKKRESSEDN